MSCEDTLNEYRTLLEKAELARLNLVGVVCHAIGNLNLNDPPQALRTLMEGLEQCVSADSAIEAFQRNLERKPIQSEKENQSDGNSAAAA